MSSVPWFLTSSSMTSSAGCMAAGCTGLKSGLQNISMIDISDHSEVLCQWWMIKQGQLRCNASCLHVILRNQSSWGRDSCTFASACAVRAITFQNWEQIEKRLIVQRCSYSLTSSAWVSKCYAITYMSEYIWSVIVLNGIGLTDRKGSDYVGRTSICLQL